VVKNLLRSVMKFEGVAPVLLLWNQHCLVRNLRLIFNLRMKVHLAELPVPRTPTDLSTQFFVKRYLSRLLLHCH
jgi:hypothetical protein